MEYLLRTLEPALHPVIVMGDRTDLEAGTSGNRPGTLAVNAAARFIW
jgi:hypothetical protein